MRSRTNSRPTAGGARSDAQASGQPSEDVAAEIPPATGRMEIVLAGTPPLPRRNRRVPASLTSRPVAALPETTAGRLPHHAFRGPSAFTRVAARMVAEPPQATPTSECFEQCHCLHRPLRLLPAGATDAGRSSHLPRNGAVPRRTTDHVLATQVVDEEVCATVIDLNHADACTLGR